MEKLIILALTVSAGCGLLYREGLMPRKGVGRSGVFALLLLAMGARCVLAGRTPSAEEDALLDALSWFRGAGGFPGVRYYSGPYAVGMQYLLASCAYTPRGSVYIFKCMEFLGDLLLAWCGQRCVRSVSGKPRPRLWVFLFMLLLPSGILASSGGMGTSFYALFPTLAAALILSGRFALGGALLGAAVAFQPMVLWVLPVFLVFPAVRENLGRTLLSLAGGYLLLLLPALLLGRSGELLFPFWPGLGAYAALQKQRGAPGLYAISPALSRAAGIAAYAVLAGLTIFRLSGPDAVHDRRRQLCALVFSALAAGALLPGMSAGALVCADGLCMALCALEAGLTPAVICAEAASFGAMAGHLFPALFPLPLYWPAALLFLGLLLLLGNVLFRK
ncbi:MAG: hypothetical protein IKH03_08500 [Oscillospiraceae bacterium]|nr:hypothetical protein [Oscillospiraceae bacterium]MBR4579593.1 hypothetical protein [Oscillospiraceae bacterium]